MSEENLEVVRRTFEAFQRGGPEAMLVELFSDDVITYRHEPDRATLYGKAGFRDAVADWTEDLASGRCFPRISPVWASGSWFGFSR
jgi:ketosteroid isomerase-like protein